MANWLADGRGGAKLDPDSEKPDDGGAQWPSTYYEVDVTGAQRAFAALREERRRNGLPDPAGERLPMNQPRHA